MKFIKRSHRSSPKVSLVLADWSVRETFHLLHYLGQQTVSRDDFEIVVVEYYGRVSAAVRQFEHQVDTWMLLEMPEECYYHKHLIYNAGLVVSRGEIIMIGDSDAMVKPTFIESILSSFNRDPKIVYHIDQFRNIRKDLYPFRYPTFEEVSGPGCINNSGGKTTGIIDHEDPLHSRNYGACMCAKRSDLISIGGADMDIDYLGHICGPYEMTFRLANRGLHEVWDGAEFMYHTWHPGQAGADNYMGPHDGRHMALAALEAQASKRVLPILENGAVAALRTGRAVVAEEALNSLIDPSYVRDWNIRLLKTKDENSSISVYKGYRLHRRLGRIVAAPLEQTILKNQELPLLDEIACNTFGEAKRGIDSITPVRSFAVGYLAVIYAAVVRLHGVWRRRVPGLQRWIPRPLALVLTSLFALSVIPVILLISPKRLHRTGAAVIQQVKDSGQLLDNTAAVLDRVLRAKGTALLGAHVILVADSKSLRFFRLLASLGLLPPFDACDVESHALARLPHKTNNLVIVISRECYASFHYASHGQSFGRTIIV